MPSQPGHRTPETEDQGNASTIGEFIDSYWKPNAEVDTYKQRRSFKKWLGRIGGAILLISIALSPQADVSNSPPQMFDYFVFGALVIGTLVLAAGAIFDFLLMRGNLNSERVACHELASAFRTYLENGSSEEPSINHHLSEAKKYLRTPGILSPVNAVRISISHRAGINAYIENYMGAVDKEAELENTFPDFMQLVADAAALDEESQIEKLSREISTGPTTPPSIREGVRREFFRLKDSVINARVGVITMGIIVAFLTYPYIGLGGGFGLGAFLITAYSIFQG